MGEVAAAGSVEHPDLLEREAEQTALTRLFERAATGSGAVLTLEGAAGIGKSSLVEYARLAAKAQGLSVALARGSSLETEVPYAAARQLLEPLMRAFDDTDWFVGAAAPAAPLFGRPGRADEAPGEVLHGLYWLTVALADAAPTKPLVLLADDVQWFDAASTRFIAYLAHRIEEHPVALVVAGRPPSRNAGDPASPQPLDVATGERLQLRPLSDRAVDRLVRANLRPGVDPDLAETIASASAGNPFLASELARAAGETSGPATPTGDAESVVRSRLRGLSPNAHTVAVAAAVLGADAELRRVAALTGLDIDTTSLVADELLDAAVLGPDRPLTFRHPLVQSAVYSGLRPGERSVWHRRAATLLRAEAAPSERVAAHLVLVEPSGDPEAVVTLRAAAARALSQGATETAIRLLRRALDEPPPAEKRLDVLIPLAIAESLVNEPGAADRFGDVIEALAGMADPSSTVTLATVRAATAALAGDGRRARRDLEAIARGSSDQETLRRVAAGAALAATVERVPPGELAARLEEVREVVPAVDPTDPANDLVDRPEVLAIRALAGAVGGEPVDTVAATARAALAALDERDPTVPLWFHVSVAALTMADRDREAAAAIEQGLTAARRAGAPSPVAIMLFQRSAIALRAGELDDAFVDASASLELCREYGLVAPASGPASVLVEVLRERDDLAAAESLLSELGDVPVLNGDDELCLFDLLLLVARARLRGAQGRWSEAAADLQHGWRLAQAATCAGPGVVAWQANMAFGQVISGVVTDARELAQAALATAEATGGPRPIAEAQRALAMAGGDDVELLNAARATFADLGARLEEARAIGAAAYALDAEHSSERIDALARAVALAETGGATRLAALFRARVRALGGSSRGLRPVSGLEALTASERRVAALAAQGQTNREVAQQLYVTVKTVETHLARTFQKLAITSRGELRGALSLTP